MAAAVMPTLKLERSTSSVDASKKPKLSHGAWPPVEVGFEFFVVRDDPKKWPLKTHTSITASAKFMVTARGVWCRELGCPNPGFAEVPEGDVNHASSLHSSDKHVASYHPPPKKTAPSVRSFFPVSTSKTSSTTDAAPHTGQHDHDRRRDHGLCLHRKHRDYRGLGCRGLAPHP